MAEKLTYTKEEAEGRNIVEELHDQGYTILRIQVGVDHSKTYTVEVPAKVEDDLASLTRTELDAIAEGLGLDPSEYSNKTKVIEAIKSGEE